jgi:hypothetical protein
MANTIAQHPTAASYSASSVQKTYGSSCTNGSILVAVVTLETSSATVTAVSDPTNGSWTERAWATNNPETGAGQGSVGIYTRANTATTALTVTATLSGATHGYLDIYEITGQDSSPIGAVAEEFGNDESPEALTLTLAKEAANSTVIAGAVFYPNNGVTFDTGFTTGLGPSAINNSYSYSEYDEDAGSSGNSVLNLGGAAGTPDNWAFAALEIKTLVSGVDEALSGSAVTSNAGTSPPGISIGL